MTTKKGVIYSSTNLTNGKVYIGKTMSGLSNRKRDHKYKSKNNTDNSYFHNALRKYGFDNFKWKIIDEHEDYDVINQLERLHISRYESNNKTYGYNLADGGEGFPCGEDHPLYGKYTEVQRMNLQPYQSGENNPNYGKKQLKEDRLKKSKNIFGYIGSYYQVKHINPYNKVWRAKIGYKNHETSLGLYHDPLSANLVYEFVLNEIVGDS